MIEEIRRSPLVCTTRARLMRDVRMAEERQAEGLVRAGRMLREASLNEHTSIADTLAELRRDAEHAAQALRMHRESHGC